MPLVQTRGAASAQGFGEFAQASAIPNYIEDVFSCFLYTPATSNTAINIPNGINLATKGGMVWFKKRTGSAQNHSLVDTVRGGTDLLTPNLDAAAYTANIISSFNTDGFTTGTSSFVSIANENFVSWTFRKQPKFFDVVTYTGTGSNTTIAHSLGSVPGSIIIKRTDTTAAWAVYHRSLANTQYLVLNSSAGAATGATWWNSTTPTSAVFSLGTDASVNASGGTYVAYIYAHDAGGFGLTGTDNVISCGSFTTDGSGNATVSLGYEPQWALIKKTTSAQDWVLCDTMRSWNLTTNADKYIAANTATAESNQSLGTPTATGFSIDSTSNFGSSSTFIYIAIRRGPMKVPTLGTSVFGLNARTGTGANATVTGGQTDDAVLVKNRGSAVASLFASRLTGTGYLVTSATAAEVAAGVTILQANPWDVMDGVNVGTTSTITNASSNTYINYLFRRAPSFFDEVCYTGTGVARTVAHNLAAVPELMIVKSRTPSGNDWMTYVAPLGNQAYLQLNRTNVATTSDPMWDNTTPTSSVFSVGLGGDVNGSGNTQVAYLFATLAGVSKVGSYTGTGALQTINCGFTSGARFVLIKRTDSTGNWWVYDSARGITSGNDPYLYLNSTAAEVTGTNYVDTDSTGFKVTAAAPAELNANGGTYIFLAIA